LDFLRYTFPVSGVDTWIFLPPLVMFVVATITSMGGISGAFVLLPFNMSVLGYTSPGVSGTNFVYNIVAIPLGLVRHIRARHMAWGLLLVFLAGILPGVYLGYRVRVHYMPSPEVFRPFVGLVLAFLVFWILRGLWLERREASTSQGTVAPEVRRAVITGTQLQGRQVVCQTQAGNFHIPLVPVLLVALAVGVVGGAYGIGGGSIIAPFCIGVLRLPPFLVAGATLFSTWVTSVVGALMYAFVPTGAAMNAAPDWLLGLLFGLGCMAGVYLGARLVGRVPALAVKIILCLILLFIATRYLAPAIQSLF